ncbi:hypothetical protein NDU88_006297 [Pleurodeles waltl]|uniref:Uncharacterized protein n=1 Tax=Pleurodeles waltl TaxID=8319 RepID=A0AAV7WA68_PLEWA|nr:hypothetical protein NDU88_006297 [Pleurodeles waltl]
MKLRSSQIGYRRPRHLTPRAELGKKSWHDPENKRSGKEEQRNKCEIQVRAQSRADRGADAREKQREN